MKPKSKKEKEYARNVRRAQIYRSMQKILEDRGKTDTSRLDEDPMPPNPLI